uniref:Putative RNA ligase n=1 Tax=viral metagenome TaxID=1070528 RepID=A0A6H1ZC99_9ZZZZ
METSWHSYPKIYNLGHRSIRDLLEDPVVVEEKIDGSQFSFGVFEDLLYVRSKGQEMLPDAPEKMFTKGVEAVRDRLPLLHEGWTYRGEYLQRPKHNALAYDRIPKGHIILFYINTAEEAYLSPEEKAAEAERIGLDVVPCFHYGRIETPQELFGLLEHTSILGGQKVEGIVIKNYHRFDPAGKAMMGKYVSEAFKEAHQKSWKEANPQNADMLTRLVTSYRTPARWQKAVQHLREQGQLVDEPKDIGPLIHEIHRDLTDECSEEIAAILLKWMLPNVLRGCAGGFPEWYKAQLAERQFED